MLGRGGDDAVVHDGQFALAFAHGQRIVHEFAAGFFLHGGVEHGHGPGPVGMHGGAAFAGRPGAGIAQHGFLFFRAHPLTDLVVDHFGTGFHGFDPGIVKVISFAVPAEFALIAVDGGGEQVHIQRVGNAVVVFFGMAQFLGQLKVFVPGPVGGGQFHVILFKQGLVHEDHVGEQHGGIGIVLAADLAAGYHGGIQFRGVRVFLVEFGQVQRPFVGNGGADGEYPEHVGQIALGGQVGQALVPGALIDGHEFHVNVGMGFFKLGDQRLQHFGLAGFRLAPAGVPQGDFIGGQGFQTFGHGQGQHAHGQRQDQQHGKYLFHE